MFFINLGLFLLGVCLIVLVNYAIYLVFEDEDMLFKISAHIIGNVLMLGIILIVIGFYAM